MLLINPWGSAELSAPNKVCASLPAHWKALWAHTRTPDSPRSPVAGLASSAALLFDGYLLTCGRISPEPSLLLFVLAAPEHFKRLQKFHVKLPVQTAMGTEYKRTYCRKDCPFGSPGTGTASDPQQPAVPRTSPPLELHSATETAVNEADGHQSPHGLT